MRLSADQLRRFDEQGYLALTGRKSEIFKTSTGRRISPLAVEAALRRLPYVEFAVLVGICTHLGCSPTHRPEVAPADLGPDWKGGFFCACHGSRFDLAGRVYSGVPAPTNLVVPPHQYLSDDVILIGVDGGAA